MIYYNTSNVILSAKLYLEQHIMSNRQYYLNERLNQLRSHLAMSDIFFKHFFKLSYPKDANLNVFSNFSFQV